MHAATEDKAGVVVNFQSCSGVSNGMCHLQVTEEEGALQEAQIVIVGAECWRQGGVQGHVGCI